MEEMGYSKEQILACCEEFIGQYKRLHENDGLQKTGKHHLYALEHLCQFGEIMGLDCTWIYNTFFEELDSKNKTIQRNYYLGGFVDALTEYECNPNQAILETAYWTELSKSKVDAAYRLYLKMSGQWGPVEFSVIFKNQKLRIADTFIKYIDKPFPEGKSGNKMAEDAFNKLKKDIESKGCFGTSLPLTFERRKTS